MSFLSLFDVLSLMYEGNQEQALLDCDKLEDTHHQRELTKIRIFLHYDRNTEVVEHIKKLKEENNKQDRLVEYCLDILSARLNYKKENIPQAKIDLQNARLNTIDDISSVLYDVHLGDYYNSTGNVDSYLGLNDLAITAYKKSLQIRTKIGLAYDISSSLNNIAVVYIQLGKYELALDYLNQSYHFKKYFKNQAGYGVYLVNVGYVYYKLGEYQNAMMYYEECLEVANKLPKPALLGYCYYLIGQLMYRSGDIDKAIMFQNQSGEIFKKFTNKRMYGSILIELGYIQILKNNLDEAFSLIDEGLAIQEVNANPYEISNLLMNSVLVFSESGYIDKANLYFEKLSQLEENVDLEEIKLRKQICEAAILINNGRLQNLVRAQSILNDVIRSNHFDIYYTSQSMILLVQLYLIEFSLLEGNDTISDINNLISELIKLSEDCGLYLIYTKSMILKAKLEYTRNNFDLGNQIIAKAERTVRNHNLVTLVDMLNREQNFLMKIMAKYARNTDISLNKKIEEMEILEYLKKIKELKSKL